jgi:hypothetical protein
MQAPIFFLKKRKTVQWQFNNQNSVQNAQKQRGLPITQAIPFSKTQSVFSSPVIFLLSSSGSSCPAAAAAGSSLLSAPCHHDCVVSDPNHSGEASSLGVRRCEFGWQSTVISEENELTPFHSVRNPTHRHRS